MEASTAMLPPCLTISADLFLLASAVDSTILGYRCAIDVLSSTSSVVKESLKEPILASLSTPFCALLFRYCRSLRLSRTHLRLQP